MYNNKKTDGLTLNKTLDLNDGDRKLMLDGSRYYDVLLEASKQLEPFKLAQFLHDLAKTFHSFYQKNQVVKDNEVHQKRLEVIIITKKIIQHCSNILGISTPEKM